MRKIENKRNISIGFIIYFISLPFFTNFINIHFKYHFQNLANINEPKFTASDHYYLDGPIIIDGNDEWASIAALNDWCNGSGVKVDPYIIQNVSINGTASASCFEIKNSNVYFIIRTCVIYNAKGLSYAGIRLWHVSNGVIANNTIIDNGYGISIEESNSIAISGNSIMRNERGVWITWSSYCKILGNNITMNWPDSPGWEYGIALRIMGGGSNTILKNNIQNNQNGIFLQDSKNNLVYYNYFINDIAYDDTSLNKWDNGTIGNYWSDYSGKDLNDDGIGDVPYKIWGPDSPVYTNKDYFPIWNDGDDVGPEIVLNSPSINQVFGENAPKYNITIQDQSAIDSMWYTIDGNLEKHFFLNDTGFINQTYWNEENTGLITISFCANDTLGHLGFKDVVIIKYLGIIINSPARDMVFGQDSPEFNITIPSLFNINLTWYTLDYGFTNYSFFGFTGDINQIAWYSKIDGPIFIRFYANDSMGYSVFTEIKIIKDTSSPKIIILSPLPNQIFGIYAPYFSLIIDELNLQEKWYSFNRGQNITFTTQNQFIQTEWDKIGHGKVSIKFYVKDKADNINSSEIVISKDIIPPILKVLYPLNGSVYGNIPPVFKISVIENSSFTTCYIILGHIWFQKYFEGTIGIIDKTQWEKIPERRIYIFFIVKDEAENYDSVEIIVIKDLSTQTLSLELGILLLIGGILLLSIAILSHIIKKGAQKTKIYH